MVNSHIQRRVKAWTSLRLWLIVISLIHLHLRFWRFHPSMLATLNGKPTKFYRVVKPTISELGFANKWNVRIASALTTIGSPYTLCMKRALIMATMLRGVSGLYVVLGINPEDKSDGHAWLEWNGDIAAEQFDERLHPYREIKRIEVTAQR